eukprot:4388442-Alexandrium_andersonii.AAC.1
MSASLVGSEMCIRDRHPLGPAGPPDLRFALVRVRVIRSRLALHCRRPVSYTHLTLPTICSV